jgi:hypothetical protein
MTLTLRQMMTGAVTVCLAASIWATDARADASAMEEVLGILRREGTIDEATQEKLLAKYAAEQKGAAKDAAGILGGFEWYGDLRLRYEAFQYDDDARGIDRDNRYRGRYRARFGFKKKVNDTISIGVRLASGGGENDSTNRSFGESPDFGPDGIFFDRAWASLSIVDNDKTSVSFVGGRVSNPFTWGEGKDFMIWDGDVNLTGAHLSTSYRPAEKSEVFFTLGSFISRENSTNADPKITGAQLGFTSEMGGMGFGVRTSLYEYRSLDDAFLAAAAGEGNLAQGQQNLSMVMDDSIGAFDDGRARVVDLTGYFELSASDSFPVLLYATYARNLEAESFTFTDNDLNIGVDDEDTAWGIGLEFGDKKKNVRFGFGWFSVEANSVVAQFMDSDLFDNRTNREGFVVYLSRQVAKNADFKLTFFDAEEIEDDGLALGPFSRSIADADRRRLQADIELKF